MGSFWKKVGAGAAIGLAFGIVAALGFISVTSAMKFFTGNKSEVVSQTEEDTSKKEKKTKEKQEEEPAVEEPREEADTPEIDVMAGIVQNEPEKPEKPKKKTQRGGKSK